MRERSRLSTSRLPSTRLTASRGAIAGKAAPDSMAAANTRRTRAAVASGRAASCTSTKSHSPSAARPARTEACRLSPPASTATRLRGESDATSRSAFSRRLGGPTTTIRSTSSSARNSSSTRASVVRPFRRTSALLPRPRRDPEPAAATMAPTVATLCRLLFALDPVPAPTVLSGGFGKDHPARRGLDHGRHDRGDGLVHQAPPVLDDDHRTVVQAAHPLTRFLALSRDHHDDLLARDRDRTHRLGKLVEVEHRHALEPRDSVEVEVVGHDPPPPALGGAHEVRVDLGARGDVVVDHLQVDLCILLHLREDVEPAPPAASAGGVSGIRHLLQLTQNRAEDHQRQVDETGLGDVEDAAVDDDRRVEENRTEAVALRLLRAPKQQSRQLRPTRDANRRAKQCEQQREHERKHDAVRQVTDEHADEHGHDEADDHAEQTADEIGQRSLREAQVEASPAAEHVRRAQVREDQSLHRGQADQHPTLMVDPREADERITQEKPTDDSDPHPDATGEGIGTLHGLPPQGTDTSGSFINAPDLMGERCAAEIASASVRTSTTSRPACRPARAPAGIKARVRPCRAASWRRRSSWPTRRTSPANPSSPIATRPSGSGLFLVLL